MLNQGVGSWLERRRVKSYLHLACVFNGAETTYSELASRANSLASIFRQWGITSGSRVAYLGENHPSFLEAFFATTQLGAIFVPMNTRLAPSELNYLVNDSGATVLVVSEALRTTAEAAIAGTPVKKLIVIDDAFTAGLNAPAAHQEVQVFHLSELIAQGSSEYIDHPVSSEDPALIMYTSGTTGHPKGAVLTHGNLTWNSYNVLVDYDIVSTDIALMISPMFHAASLGMGVLPALLKGATLILEAGFEPGRVLELIQKYKATSISGVPTTYQMLCEHPDWESTDISSLQKLTCGGSPVPLRVIEAYEERGLAFTGGYGMTETAPGATSLQPDRSKSKAGSAGLPHFFTSVRIADESGRQQAQGEVGEIQITGPNVIAEYWNLPEASREAFTDDGWFKSGDMGYTDDEGFLFISDRLKDMIISGGENIYPAEIENVLMRFEFVSSAAVIGISDDKWGEVPLALLVVTLPEIDINQLRNELLQDLARYKVPKKFVIIAEMPRTASGKIKKPQLRQLVSEAALSEVLTDLR